MAHNHVASRDAHDDGFTLIEALVAALVAVVILVAFAGAMTSAMRASRLTHSDQSATAIATEHLEFARSLEWEELAMTSVHVDAPHVDASGTVLVGAEVGLAGNEALVVSASGGMAPLIEEGVDTNLFTVWRYVTEVDNGLRRVVVEVTWQIGEATYTHQATTLIAEVSTR